jgi:capsular exopolysaccharide synthesis family protein
LLKHGVCGDDQDWWAAGPPSGALELAGGCLGDIWDRTILRLAPSSSEALANDHTQRAAWLVPEGEQQGLRRYLETLRERWKLIVLAVIVATAAAVIYVASATKSYEARSHLLVTPIANDNDRLLGLGLIPQSADPTRDVETAAALVTTVDVSRIARQKLGVGNSPSSLLDHITAAPVAQSNVVVINAQSSSARFAQRLANAFGEAVVQDRTQKLHRQLDLLISNLRGRVASGGGDGGQLKNRLAVYETLRAGNDPTIRLDDRAELPTSASSPRPKLSIAAGIVAGLLLGVGAAFAASVLDPRLRREDQLRAGYRLPILARIPDEGRIGRGRAIPPGRLSRAGVDAFRALRANVASRAGTGAGRAIVVTGSSPAEGKTTTALNLAASLALAGSKVVLIEADLRHPALASVLGAGAGPGIASVLLDDVPLAEALVATESCGPNLRVLLADRAGEWMADHFSLPRARALVEEAKQLADYVIVDSPPLTTVVDSLPLVQMADSVLVVARIGKTDRGRLERLAELLAQHEIAPLGFVLVGAGRARAYAYHGSAGGDSNATVPKRADDREPALRAS